MAKITYSRAFDIQKQFYLADWSDAAFTAAGTGLTLQFGGATMLLSGSFSVSGGQVADGKITGLTYSTGITTPVTEFSLTGLSLNVNQALAAMADGDLAAVFGAGNDVVTGTSGNDRLYGYGGNDRLEGLGGNDSLFGSYGNDTLDGGAGNDYMQGGSGDDTYVVNAVGDRIIEVAGGGTDSVQTSLTTYTLSSQLENLRYTGTAAFTGTGNAADNLIVGSTGNDTLAGLDGNDTLRGGNGNDVLNGGNGNDFLVGDAGANALTTSVSGVSPTDAALPLTLSMTLPEVSATTSATVTGYINNANLDAPVFNLAFVLDTSGSMAEAFSGANVGDVNGDGSANEKIDAAIASFNALVNSIKAAGLGGMTRIALIPFNYSADIRAVGTPTSDANANGVVDLIEAAQKIAESGGTYYGYGLDKAIEFFNGSPRGNNFVFFLSDGQPSDSAYATQLSTLRDDAGIDATIRSLGFEAASSGYLNVLDQLDDGKANNSAIDVRTPDNLTAGLLSSQVKLGDVKQLEIYKNGTLVKTLAPDQLTETPFGLKYSYAISGLSDTAASNIETRLVLNDGVDSYISTSQQLSVGKLLSNDSLVGGAGNDTLDGGAGTDTLVGGTGNDLYHIETAGTVIRELANEGTDAVEATISYSLNATALQNVENLTLLGSGNINGTGNAGANRIEGNMGNNVLNGLGGNDTLVGGYGIDIASYADATQGMTVNLGTGVATATGEADQLVGIEGVWGSNFNDSLTGSNGDDVFRGNGGNDTISGGAGMDTVDYSAATAGMTVSLNYTYYSSYYGTATCADGSQGTDYISAYDVEIIIGSAFNDSVADLYGIANRFDGGDGNDVLSGGNGNDTLIGGNGNDTLQGGAGIDVADYSAATAAISGSLLQGKITVGTGTTNVDTLTDIEQVIGSKFADSVAGSLQGDILQGGAGNDTLSGDAGNDTLNGGAGNDSMSGGAGDDVFYVDAAGDVFDDVATGGTDTVYFEVASGNVTKNMGQVEVAYLAGGALYNITGGAVQNNINGGQGNDTINGGTGMESDTLSGGEGVDWLSYAGHQSAVRGTLNQNYYNTIDGDVTSGFENFLGSDYTDVVSGDSYNNILDGAKGDDSLNGGYGDDTLIGGAGNDLLDGDSGFDTVSYAHLTAGITIELSTGVVTTNTTSDGADTLVEIEHVIGGAGADAITWSGTSTSSSAFLLEGGAGNDTLIGSYYADTLVGGAGDDSLNGGNSSNYYYGNYTDVVDYSAATAAVVVDLAAGTATGGAGSDKLANIEGVLGSAFADKLTGSTQQTDYLTGGAGADTLDGGIDSYSDVFVYKNVADSSGTAVDTIKNFISTGYYADRIDLSAIDANTADSYDSYFSFIGTSAFSGKAGELRYENTETDTFIYGDVNGDQAADLCIKLVGVLTLSSYSSFSL